MEYNQDYQNEQAFSGVFKTHLDAVTEIIRRHLGGQSLLEVGCGKGYFLEHLQTEGFDITGIDPAYEGDNPGIISAAFTKSLDVSAPGIVLRHVLEHIPDPVSFLSNIAEANGDEGIIYIEVPCFDWICKHRAWTDIFYEHVNYFRLSDFDRMFGSVLESGHVFNGQYLYIVADLATLHAPRFDATSAFQFPEDFLVDVNRMAGIAKDKPRNVIWGGASKGVIFAIYMKRAGVENFEFVIDINPAKQGKYLAGSGLPVLAPDKAMQLLRPRDPIFVMNSNYLEEIVAQTESLYQYYKVDNA